MSHELFDPDLLDDENPFELDTQAAHLFKHPHLGVQDVYEVWVSDPLFYPAKPPAHWLTCAEVANQYRRDPMKTPMTPEEEYDYYARPENQEPQGPLRRRRPSPLTEVVPVRFPADLLEQVRQHADADDRSLSAWIRRAVEHELRRSA